MSDKTDREYDIARAAAARALAKSAKSEQVVGIHLAMAAQYEELAHLADNDDEPEINAVNGCRLVP